MITQKLINSKHVCTKHCKRPNARIPCSLSKIPCSVCLDAYFIKQRQLLHSEAATRAFAQGVMDYIKGTKPILWTIALSILDDISNTIESLPTKLAKGNKYYYLVKIVFLNKDPKSSGKIGHNYLMCGTQAFFNYESVKSIVDLSSDIQDKVKITMDDYNYDYELQYVQVMFWPLDLNIIKTKVDSIDTNSALDSKKHSIDFNIPINIDKDMLSNPLSVVIDDKGFITDIKTRINGTNNFISQIEKNRKISKLESFDSSWKFYEVIYNFKKCILGIRNYHKDVTEKVLFSKTGTVLLKVVDHYNEKGEFTTRFSSNKIINGLGDKIYSISRNLYINAIPNKLNKNNIFQNVSNNNIGSLDCETFKDNDNITKIFALGFKESLDKEAQLYHINDYEGDPNKMVIKFIEDIMSPRLTNITFYCHNWGGYDSIFIIKIINDYNQNVENKYSLTYQFRDNKIFKLVIHNKLDRNRKVTICDSYTILTASLSELCRNFEINENKGFFPYSFVSRDTMKYIGVTPSRDYYPNINIEDYNKLLTSNWNIYEESMNYLNNDIDILLKVLNKANHQLFEDYNVNISDKGTIAGLATKIFMKEHYKGNIPLINKSTLYNDIKEAYYGGITEVYKPYGENLYYYDVNSLYPSVSLNAMPGVNNTKKVDYIDIKPNINNLFGFFYCDIESPTNLYIGVLPVRNKEGLIFPLGKFSGWYFSEELKFAKSLGYNIIVHKGYTFEKQYDTFKSYVDKIYSIKNNPVNKTQKAIAKGLLNNLLGRFGISLHKPLTKIVNKEQFKHILSINRIIDHKSISDNSILVTYYDILDPYLIEESGISINSLDEHFSESSFHNNTSIAISAAVTAYARIAISKIKLDILNKGNNIYYSDTDSIITDAELPFNMVSKTEIGKLKLEHKINKAIFISGKTYCIIDSEGNFINKAKGISNTSLNYKDYENMLNNIVVFGKKNQSKVNWADGEVVISSGDIVLSSDVYKKRHKIYESGIWKDTKPIMLNKTEVDISYNKGLRPPTITTKRLFSTLAYNKLKSSTSIYNFIEYFKGYKTFIKDFLFYLLLVIVLSISILAYCMTEDEFTTTINDNEEVLDTEDNNQDIDLTNTTLKGTKKGIGLLDDSLYNNEEYIQPNSDTDDNTEVDDTYDKIIDCYVDNNNDQKESTDLQEQNNKTIKMVDKGVNTDISIEKEDTSTTIKGDSDTNEPSSNCINNNDTNETSFVGIKYKSVLNEAMLSEYCSKKESDRLKLVDYRKVNPEDIGPNRLTLSSINNNIPQNIEVKFKEHTILKPVGFEVHQKYDMIHSDYMSTVTARTNTKDEISIVSINNISNDRTNK